jgi:hypothetical protein
MHAAFFLPSGIQLDLIVSGKDSEWLCREEISVPFKENGCNLGALLFHSL